MAPLDPGWVALIATVLGGVGLKIVEHWLARNKVKIDDATTIRNELRLEIAALRAENAHLEDEVDLWREKYYENYEAMIRLRTYATIHGLDPPADVESIVFQHPPLAPGEQN